MCCTRRLITHSAIAFLLCATSTTVFAERNRINRIDNTRRVRIPGHLHPSAISANDEGQVDPSFVLPSVTLALKPSDAQQVDLDKFLEQQQDPSSPNYHRWLTPEEYADRFGVSSDD